MAAEQLPPGWKLEYSHGARSDALGRHGPHRGSDVKKHFWLRWTSMSFNTSAATKRNGIYVDLASSSPSISNSPDEEDSLGKHRDEWKQRPTSAVHFHETWSVLTQKWSTPHPIIISQMKVTMKKWNLFANLLDKSPCLTKPPPIFLECLEPSVFFANAKAALARRSSWAHLGALAPCGSLQGLQGLSKNWCHDNLNLDNCHGFNGERIGGLAHSTESQVFFGSV